jgi:sugar lactone lactonase YvrE
MTPLLLVFLLVMTGPGVLISCDSSREETPGVTLEIVSGDGQTGPTGQELPEAARVRVKRTGGNAAAGLTVSFRVSGGGGSLSGASTVTDENGVASVRWTLGAAPVWNRITAETGGNRVSLQAWATPGTPPAMELAFQAPAGFNSEGIAFQPGRGLFLGTEGGLLLSPAPGVDPRPLPLSGEEILGPLGLAFGPTGDQYVCDNRTPYGDVKRVSPDGTCGILSPEFGEQPFSLPNSLAVDAGGQVYLTSTCDDRIYRIAQDTGEAEEFLSISGPNGIAFNGDNSFLYITTENPAIFCNGPWIPGGLFRVPLNPDGTAGQVEALVEDFAVAGDGLAFDAEENLYVVFSGIQALSPGDLLTSVIYVYTPDGRFNPWISVSVPGDIFTNIAFGVAPFDPLSVYCYGFTGRVYRAFLGIPGRPLPGP